MTWMRVNGLWEGLTPEQLAPVQQERTEYGRQTMVPLALAEEAYKEYAARYGTSQSLARLNERGGFGLIELAILLYDRIKRIEGTGKEE